MRISQWFGVSCSAAILAQGCSLQKIDPVNWDHAGSDNGGNAGNGGTHAKSGTSGNANGAATHQGGASTSEAGQGANSAGGGNGGTSNVGGTMASGGTATLGGTAATGGTSAASGSSSIGGGGAGVSGAPATGGTSAAGGSSAMNGGATAIGGASGICTGTQTRSCALAGALGTCATGTQACDSGRWGACSILPAATDNCTPGNDDNCNGTPNETACKVLQIAAGNAHTCALLTDGMVRCWGANFSGQLGNGTKTMSAKPVLVKNLAGVTSLSARGANTCAVWSAGKVSCWGDNSFGQLGSGATAAVGSTAVEIQQAAAASSVAVGGSHICLLGKADGNVQCWGDSSDGKLGDRGTAVTGNVPMPGTVVGIVGATSVAAGRAHTCVSNADTTSSCWGKNDHGQLGASLPVGLTSTDTPISVSTNHGYHETNVSSVSCGSDFSCDLAPSGTVGCWGANANGQLGQTVFGVGIDNNISVSVSSSTGGGTLNGATAVEAGESYACAVVVGDSAYCWGANGGGQLGNGTTVDTTLPVPVTLSGVSAITAGSSHTCAIRIDGSAQCWGMNTSGQLGDNSVAQRLTPVKVLNLLP